MSVVLHTLSILYNALAWVVNSKEPAVAIYDEFMLSTLGGVISIFIAALFFGLFGIFCKTKATQRVKMDPVIFQFLFTIAICASNSALLLYLPFRFSIWGFLSGVVWEPSSIFAICAIVFLSLSVGQSIWSGTTSNPSFWFNALFFTNGLSINAVALSFVVGVLLGEPVGNWFFSLSALALIVILLLFLGTLPFLETTPIVKSVINRILAFFSKKETEESSMLLESTNDDGSVMVPKRSVKEIILNQRRPLLGVVFALLCGTLNSMMMLPVKASPPSERGIPLIYSQGIGIVFTSTIIVTIYIILHKIKTGHIPAWHLDVAMRPVIISGIMWNIGNYFSMYATLSPLGMTGFALTQFAVLVGGASGIILYREIKDPLSIVIFFILSLVMLCCGVLLAEFGPSG